MAAEKVPMRVMVCAAQRFGTAIVCSPRHHDEVMNYQIAMARLVISAESGEKGFVDQHGIFMDPREALAVATAAGQINARGPKHPPLDELVSEDLY